MTYLDEVGRKAIHLGSAVFPLLYYYTNREFMLALMGGIVLFALAIEIPRQFFPAVERQVQRLLGRILRIEEKKLFTGATYVAIGNLLAIALFPKPIAITVLLFMSISDALASLIGIKFGRARFLGKSLEGSMAFLVSAILIALWQLPGQKIVGVGGAVVAMVVEALSLRFGGIKVDDNLAIPLVAGAAMVLFQQFIWPWS